MPQKQTGSVDKEESDLSAESTAPTTAPTRAPVSPPTTSVEPSQTTFHPTNPFSADFELVSGGANPFLSPSADSTRSLFQAVIRTLNNPTDNTNGPILTLTNKAVDQYANQKYDSIRTDVLLIEPPGQSPKIALNSTDLARLKNKTSLDDEDKALLFAQFYETAFYYVHSLDVMADNPGSGITQPISVRALDNGHSEEIIQLKRLALQTAIQHCKNKAKFQITSPLVAAPKDSPNLAFSNTDWMETNQESCKQLQEWQTALQKAPPTYTGSGPTPAVTSSAPSATTASPAKTTTPQAAATSTASKAATDPAQSTSTAPKSSNSNRA